MTEITLKDKKGKQITFTQVKGGDILVSLGDEDIIIDLKQFYDKIDRHRFLGSWDISEYYMEDAENMEELENKLFTKYMAGANKAIDMAFKNDKFRELVQKDPTVAAMHLSNLLFDKCMAEVECDK